MKAPVKRIREWARPVKRDVLVVYLVTRDSRVPWPVKMLAAAVAADALSPIDLIPDFIPVVGYLDDLVIVPLGILAVVKLVPAEVLAELRKEAARRLVARPRSWAGAAVIVALWLVLLALLVRWLVSLLPVRPDPYSLNPDRQPGHFHEVRFPDNIAYGATGGPEFATTRCGSIPTTWRLPSRPIGSTLGSRSQSSRSDCDGRQGQRGWLWAREDYSSL